MQNIVSRQGQSFFDVVVHSTGDIDNAVALAIINGRSITDAIDAGTALLPAPVTSPAIVSLWNPKNIPASALNPEDYMVVIPPAGIGAMAIEISFIVA